MLIRKTTIHWLLGIMIFCFACTREATKTEGEFVQEHSNDSDTVQAIQIFICGLWSLDSGNSLNNTGYYFRSDGTVDFVAAEATGTWKILSNNYISMSFVSNNEEFTLKYNLDSLSEDKMILSDSDGTYLFRKVPFGMNNEGNVLSGYSGSLNPGDYREYTFDIPAAKKMELRLTSSNPDIVFNVFEGNKEITSVGVRNWSAIMIRSGKYNLRISNPENSKIGEFDLKVIGY